MGGGPDASRRRRVETRVAVKAARIVRNRAERKAAMKATADALSVRPALTIVFDREGWSTDLFRWLAETGIAIITRYKGDPGENWSESDFRKMLVPIYDSFGVKCEREYLVAEKKILLDAAAELPGEKRQRKRKKKRKAKADAPETKRNEEDHLEAREMRRLRSDGGQAVFLTTDFSVPLERIAGRCSRAGRRRTSSNTRRSGSIWGG